MAIFILLSPPMLTCPPMKFFAMISLSYILDSHSWPGTNRTLKQYIGYVVFHFDFSKPQMHEIKILVNDGYYMHEANSSLLNTYIWSVIDFVIFTRGSIKTLTQTVPDCSYTTAAQHTDSIYKHSCIAPTSSCEFPSTYTLGHIIFLHMLKMNTVTVHA